MEASISGNNEVWNAVALQQHVCLRLNFGGSSRNHSQQQSRPLSLAQKLNLVERPPDPLTDDEWNKVKQVSLKRLDPMQPCSICQDFLGPRDQVILDCSHVFHGVCLASFEKFTQIKACPLCRKEQYQKKHFPEGKQAYQEKCAIKIQSCWRGHRARKRYFLMLLEKDPKAKREFYVDKLGKLSDKLNYYLERKQNSIDSIIEQMDRTRETTRLLFMTDLDWNEVRQRALQRGSSECPICMGPMMSEDGSSTKSCLLLSCSHVFHRNCLESFESFKCSRDSSHNCPVCRAVYAKQPLE